jgi:DNA-binding IclR family transcriptional regulator
MRQTTRVLDLLESLAGHGDVSLANVAGELGIPRASAHRLLVALEERHYVEHDSDGRVYRLGPAVRDLAARSTKSALVRLGAPALAQLRAKTGETINLAAFSGSTIVYAATLDGVHQPKMSATVGHEVEPHATALGKAVLSALSPEERATVLPPAPYPAYTPATITDADDLAVELAAVAARGYAVELEESTVGAACVAVPILDVNGKPVGAISISGVPARLPAEMQATLAADLRSWCELIGTRLGGAEMRTVA